MMRTSHKWLAAVAAALVPVIVIACNDTASNPAAPGSANGPSFSAVDLGAGDHLATFEQIEVCKSGSAANITVNMSQTAGPTSVTHSFADGDCEIMGNFDGAHTADITASEDLNSLPAGVTFDHVTSTVIHRNPSAPADVVTSTTNAFSYTGANNNVGILLEFFNTPIQTGGGQGCTPGYWKQPQHFDSWFGYSPNQPFSSVFEDAFPGMSLLQVLGQGGGGLNALGRHTVAALLNAASGGVNYNLSTTDVINAFNAVFPGGDYEGQKNIFEGFNTQSCPLN